MNRIFSFFAWGLSVLLLLTACSQEPKEKPPVMLVGTNAEFPPFSFVKDGNIVGFDIDIAKEVSERLGKQIRLKDVPFEALIPDVVLGQVDFVAAGVTSTEERAEKVAFTRPHLHGEPFVIVVLARGEKPENLILDDLQGKTVIVNEGYTADLLISPVEGIELVRLSTTADAFLALKSGRGDAFITAKSTLYGFEKTQGEQLFWSYEIPGTAENSALMFPKESVELQQQVQQVLEEMEADGTIKKLKKKWNLS